VQITNLGEDAMATCIGQCRPRYQNGSETKARASANQSISQSYF